MKINFLIFLITAFLVTIYYDGKSQMLMKEIL